ncbi:hypothetical protein BD626DRAFT_574670 [Schizophyllum amplum]|uniref:Uncharacterized protein n=1 Tax=Schizophyllum amplum TaxID=97359 RepID=A0A550BSJ3_9AGAR|nr:hypothetical protein BD626DRAFT_577378 [Auriculariopsis ampla]TRM56039.1 hypothetical protein BD626DRAFT_576205 [Auriculariopsis ampla]TRM57358.1 hypothetical protein BD626DRAFT_574670 [Auriculariopsis ampla]
MCIPCAKPDCPLAKSYPLDRPFMEQVKQLLELEEYAQDTEEELKIAKSRLAHVRKAVISWSIAEARGKTIAEWNADWIETEEA